MMVGAEGRPLTRGEELRAAVELIENGTVYLEVPAHVRQVVGRYGWTGENPGELKLGIIGKHITLRKERVS